MATNPIIGEDINKYPLSSFQVPTGLPQTYAKAAVYGPIRRDTDYTSPTFNQYISNAQSATPATTGSFNPNTGASLPGETGGAGGTTAQTANDLWMKQGETPEQYQVRTGMTTAQTGTAGSLGAPNQGSLDELAAYNSLAAQGLTDSTATFDSASEQSKYTNLYQDRINSINSLYQDLITQSRANNAPVYAAREQQGRLSQVQGGLVGNPMGEAQVSNIQTANQKEQASAEALLVAQARQEINAIYGKVDDQVARAQERFDQAKAEGGKTYAEAIKNRNAVKKSILDEALDGVAGKTITDADVKSFAEKLGLSPEYVRNELDKKNAEYEASQAKAQTEAEKAAADLENKKADTAKTVAETEQVGKMTPYQAQQIAVEWYKAQNPVGTETSKKADAFGKVVSLLSPEVQSDGSYKSATIPNSGGVPFIAQGYLTPEGWKEAVRVAASEGIKREDLLTQVRDKFSPDNLKNYGLTASDIKIINGALPEPE